jgi:pimeloyl-ACP methyl ester carboxylesterase
VILAHDIGACRAAELSLALELQERGFEVLALDLRGHGESGGSRATYGLHEKRDVIAAFDFLSARHGRRLDRVGAFGAGTGAHAVVLAAADRPGLRVLVLDGLYPDASYPLAREVFRGWDWGIERLRAVPGGILAVTSGMRGERARAAEVLGTLLGRHVLLLAPANDPDLGGEIRAMFERVPEQVDADGNLVVVPRTQAQGLYGEDLAVHHERVVSFFVERLGGGAQEVASN